MTYLKNKYLLILISIFILTFSVFYFSPATGAVSSTPTPTDSSSTNSTDIKQQVEERIQKVLTSTTDNKKAYVGEITDINTIIELETDDGEKQIKIDNATFIGTKGETIKLEKIEIGNYIIAMGYLDENGTLDAKRIEVITKPKADTRKIVFGKITDLSSDGEKVLTVKSIKGDEVFEVDLNDKTVINKKIEDKVESIDFEEIKIGDYLAAIGQTSEGGKILTAKLIYLISSKSSETEETITPTQPATKSATATPTKPKASPTPTE